MMKKSLLLPVALLFGFVAMPLMAEDAAPQPRTPAKRQMQMPQALKAAVDKYRQDPSDENAAALKKAITTEVDARIKKHADKAANRDQEIDKMFARLTAAPKAPGAQGQGNRMFTQEEVKKTRELRQAIAKLDAKTPEAAAKVAELNDVYKQAAARVEKALDQAREEGKETAGLEKSLQMLNKQIEQTGDVAKCVAACKNQKDGKAGAPQGQGKRKGKGKEKKD